MVSFFPRNAVLPQCDLGTNKQRHVCKLRPSISHPVGTGCLAHYPKKSNRMNARHKQACGWTHKHKTQSNSFSFQQSYTSTLCSPVPKAVTHRNAEMVQRPSFGVPVSRTMWVHTSLSCVASPFPNPAFSPHPLFFLTFPSLILVWPVSQGRWSMQADAPHPVHVKEKQSLDAKQTKSA